MAQILDELIELFELVIGPNVGEPASIVPPVEFDSR